MKKFKDEYYSFIGKRKVFNLNGYVRSAIEGPHVERMFKAFPDSFKHDASKSLRQLFGPCAFEEQSHWREYIWRFALDGSNILWVSSGRLGTSFFTNEESESPCAVKRAVEIVKTIKMPTQRKV